MIRLDGAHYGIAAERVVEIHALGDLAPHPHGSGVIRGVARLRGRHVPIVDLRRRMGLPERRDHTTSLVSTLIDAEAAHRAWVDGLEASIRGGHAFEGATDPHACTFGRWYDAFVAPTPRIADLVSRFGGPHERLHAVACKTQKLLANGDVGGALALTDQARLSILSEMNGLFARVRMVLTERVPEIIVYVEVDGAWRGLAVDAVDAVLPLSDRRDPDLSESGAFVREVASIPGREDSVFVLDVAALLRGAARAA